MDQTVNRRTFDVALHENDIVDVAVAYERLDLGTDFVAVKAEDEVLTDLSFDLIIQLCIT